MPKVELEGINVVESQRARLGYVSSFRLMLREYPGIVKTALSLTQIAEQNYNPGNIQVGLFEFRWNRDLDAWEGISRLGKSYDDDPWKVNQAFSNRGLFLKQGEMETDPETGLEVTILGKSNREFRSFGGYIQRRDVATYMKMKLKDQAFFVKKSTATLIPGFEEFMDTARAKHALKELDFVNVTDMQIGYADERQSWFVSKWQNLEEKGFFPLLSFYHNSPNDFGEWLPRDITTAFRKGDYPQISERHRQIQEALQAAGVNVQDLEPNLFYNPFTKNFFLLDVSVFGQRRIGQG